MSLTRQELHDLAAAGAVAKVKDFEQQLATLHHEWPELFLSATPPVLLAPSLKPSANGNGHWPPVLASPAAAARPAARGGAASTRVAAREQQILALVAQHPVGVGPTAVREALHLDASTTIRALGRLCRNKQLRRASRGLYVLPGTPGAAPAAAPQPQRTRKGWTPAMRAAAAKRMRARHRDPKFKTALAAGLKKAQRARHAK